MENVLNQEVAADKDSAASLTLEQIEKYLTSDLAVVRTLLAAIHDDPNLLRLMAVHLHGRAQNYNLAQENLDRLKAK